MANVEFSPAALRKLSGIREYIANELHSPVAARNTVNGILDAIERLERFPESAPLLSALYDKTPTAYAQSRFLVCGNYVAIYDYDGKTVRVLQIYHGSEDYIRHLFRTQ